MNEKLILALCVLILMTSVGNLARLYNKPSGADIERPRADFGETPKAPAHSDRPSDDFTIISRDRTSGFVVVRDNKSGCDWFGFDKQPLTKRTDAAGQCVSVGD